MKNIIFIIFTIFFSVSANAQTLDDYLIMAEKNNPGLKAKFQEFEAAMQKVSQVKSLPDPSFSVSAFGQMTETRVGQQQAIFNLNQMFPWFGTLKIQGNVAVLMAEAKFQDWLDNRNNLHYEVKETWYQLFELEEIIRYQIENKSILESNKTLAISKFKNSSGSMVDAIRVDIMLDDINNEIKLLEVKRVPITTKFNLLLNRDQSTPVIIITPDTPTININHQANYDSISIGNPKLIEIDRKIETWKSRQMLAKKEGLPKLGLGINYIIVGERKDMDFTGNGKDAFMPMLSVSLPIYRKKYNSSIKEAELMKSSLEYMKSNINNSILTMYESTWYEVIKSYEEFGLFQSQIEKTQQATNLLLSAYSNSGKEFEEVLRIQQLLIKYKIASVTAIKNYHTAMAKLDYLTAKN